MARQPNHEVTILKQIDTLIIGATALAYPLAARLGGAALVVESGFSVGAEFSEAMIAERVKNADSPGSCARSLKSAGFFFRTGGSISSLSEARSPGNTLRPGRRYFSGRL